MPKKSCFFCKSSDCDAETSGDHYGVEFYRCHAICGPYAILGEDPEISETQRMNAMAETIRHNEEESGRRIAWGTFASPPVDWKVKSFEECSYPIQHSQKPFEILRLAEARARQNLPFEFIKLAPKDACRLRIQWPEECWDWIKYLHDKGLIESVQTMGSPPSFKITPDGWGFIESELSSGARLGFIAMKFTGEVEGLEDAITSACATAGWSAKTVRAKEHINRIDDEIIAMIKSSQIVVADMTGQNQGVYWEAGFAHALGKKVIYTARQDEMANVHFDTRSFNHICWNNLDDLKDKLTNRIRAIID